MLEQQMTARYEMLRCAPDDVLERFEPCRTRDEREGRLVFSHLRQRGLLK